MKALTIRQPWAWLIVNGHKDIENRTWKLPKAMLDQTILIHASKKIDYERGVALAEILAPSVVVPRGLPMGGIVGSAKITGCVDLHNAPDDISRWWNTEGFGFVLTGAVSLPFVPCKGALGFWNVPESVLWDIDKAVCQAIGEAVAFNGRTNAMVTT